MSTFNKEQLIAAACSRIDFAKQMLRGNPLPLAKRKWEIELSLSEIALASLEAEPVGEFYHEKQGGWYQISEGDKVSDNRRIPLYPTPSALVSVPDEATPENIEILASTFAPRGVTYQWDRDECNAAADSWNACRAAMLQGAEPVSNLDELPDGWVACSERMPDAGDDMYPFTFRALKPIPKSKGGGWNCETF